MMSFLGGAVTTQIYKTIDNNNVSNSVITLIVGYCVYIPIFSFLFYRDNKSRYIDPVTKRRNYKNIKNDIIKIWYI